MGLAGLWTKVALGDYVESHFSLLYGRLSKLAFSDARCDASLILITDHPLWSNVNRDTEVLSSASRHISVSLKPIMYWNRQREAVPCPFQAPVFDC